MKLFHILVIFSFISALKLIAADKVKDIETPEGYNRINYQKGSYSDYLQNLPLKSDNVILEWDGSRLQSSWLLYNVFAVVDKPLLFKADLEQCADFPMRFWADYHKENNKLDKLYLFNYQGQKIYFKDSLKPYKKYLRWHMAYSNSYSIKKGAKKISDEEKLHPGDMFVQNEGGGIGHVSVIVDAAENRIGQRVYLIGFSYIPAQEFHIEKADDDYGHGGWFTKQGFMDFLSGDQFGRFGKAVLRRF